MKNILERIRMFMHRLFKIPLSSCCQQWVKEVLSYRKSKPHSRMHCSKCWKLTKPFKW